MSLARDKSYCADKRGIRDETDSQAFVPIAVFPRFKRISNGLTLRQAGRARSGGSAGGCRPVVSRQGIHGLNARRFKI